jgi:hypothetical protein
VGIGVNSVYEVYEGWIVALDLVAWSGAELEDFAVSGADKGGDTGGVFIGNKAVGCARELVCTGWVKDREVTSYDEEFCDGGVSNSLGMCK